jgi:hypothetical protein
LLFEQLAILVRFHEKGHSTVSELDKILDEVLHDLPLFLDDRTD